jgi:arabinofuranan 3-O-arabinosyltransferase
VTLRQAASWLGRAVVLAALCSAAVLVKLVVGAGSFSARLSSTETPAAVSGASSWAESLRGMGFWVSYFADPFGLDRPQGRVLLAVVPVVLLTFVPAIVALVTLARSRWRPRFLFGAFLVAGGFLMVGGYPPGAPPPWGRLWLDTLEANEAAALLRSTYKAGSSLMLGMAVLFGVGVVEAVRAAAGARPALRHLPAVGAALVLVAITSPFWTGSLYDPDQRLDAVAPHWREAIAWLDEQPGDDRVLFLPGGTRTAYRWGRPGDDVLDALLERPHASDMPISPTAPLAADVLRAVDDRAVDGSYRPGTMGPTLRRLGVEFVVLRNDLDWRRMGVPRPSAYDAIRDDEDLERVAAFGTLVDGDAVEELGEDEATLPALEVLRVRDHRSRLRVAAAEPPTIVSGSGSSWFTLARAGLLEEGSPVVYSATRTASQLAAALEGGARAVVTDGNRRQGVAVVSYDADASRLLARGEQLDRPVPELFTPRGSETVARFGDARRIAELTPARSLVGFQPQRRPALAFDGDEGTGWVSNGQFDQQGFRVDFAAPRVIDAIEVVGLEDAGARVGLPGDDPVGSSRIRRATVTLSDGTDLDVNLSTGRFEIRLQPTVTTSVELRIVDQTGAGAVGIAEMRFPGADLDLEEVPEVPDDLFRAAAASGDLARVLDRVGVDYAFERVTGAGRVPEEPQLRRGFRSVGASRPHAVRGELARSRTLDAGCTDIGLSVDGRAVLVRAAASSGASTTAFVGCRDVVLGDGHHVVRGDGAVLDLVVLSGAEGARRDGEGGPLPVEDLQREPSSATLTLPAPDEAVLISGEAFDERWEAELDGDALGAPVPMDAQSGWLVPASAGERRVTLAFTPQRTLDISLLVSSVAVVGCLVCACRRTRP